MKICRRCQHENADGARFCQRCRHAEFAGAPITPATPPDSNPPLPGYGAAGPRPAKPGPEYLTTEREGKLAVLKCRTPGEALLVAAELEAADILVVFPDNDALEQEFETYGQVSLRVSAQSYEAARELQTVIERKHWTDRTQAPLSWPMVFVALLFGFLVIPGAFGLFMIHQVYRAKGYERKAKTFPWWFLLGVGLLFGVIGVLSNRTGH